MVWKRLLSANEGVINQNLQLKDWITDNVSGSLKGDGSNKWAAHFAIVVWCLWKWRNAKVFSNMIQGRPLIQGALIFL